MTEPIWSTGGAGGEHAVTEDLEWAVGVLKTAAADVATAQTELARRWAAAELDHGVGRALATELERAAWVVAPRLEDDIDDTARRLAAVAGAFIEAERAARRHLGLSEVASEAADDAGATQWWGARVAATGIIASTPVGALLVASGHADVLTTMLPHDAPPTTALLNRDSVETALDTPFYEAYLVALKAIMCAPIVEWLTAWRGSLEADAVAAAPVRSVEDAMRAIFATQAVSGGAVRIERWTGADGVTRRVVFVPGTEDWLNLTGNPLDSRADVDVMLGKLPDAARLVAAALAADGAGPGDPVMLAGHSLGGMVVTALAANPAFTRRFNVTALVTAGSPVGRVTLPSTVNALHLEGTRDIVPGLDGAPNPDTPTRVTVHHDARKSEVPALDGAGRTIGSAHHLNTYAQTARLVDEGLDPSTEAWLASASEFLEPEGEVVTTDYRP